MKLLLVSHEGLRDSGGGVATYVRHSMAAYAKHGWEVTVLAPNRAISADIVRTTGSVRTVEFNPDKYAPSYAMGYVLGLSQATAVKIQELIESGFAPDWVEFPEAIGIGYLAIQRKLTLHPVFRNLRIATVSHCPAVIIDHLDGKNQYHFPRYSIGEMEAGAIRTADVAIAPSHFHARGLVEHWPSLSDIDFKISRNPIDVESIEFRQVDDAAPVYATSARVSPSKGTLELLTGFESYWKAGGKSRLLVRGDDTLTGPGDSSYTAFLSGRFGHRLSEGLLTFTGLLDHRTIREQNATVVRALIHPSRYESFGYAVAESMAGGVVVAASTRGGQVEYIEDGESGLLFDPEDFSSVHSTIERLDDMTSADRRRMGTAAREAIQRVAGLDRFVEDRASIMSNEPMALPTRYPLVSKTTRATFTGAKSKSPTLTIITPHFNLGPYVRQTIAAALASDHPDFELLLIDDGSTDAESRKVIDALEGSDRRLRVLRKANEGAAATRNFGVQQAAGQYVAFLDADDYPEPSYYSKATAILDQYENVGFVGCWYRPFDDNGTLGIAYTSNPELPRSIVQNTINSGSIVVRKEAFAPHRVAISTFAEDWDAVLAMMGAGARGVVIPEVLFNYRVRANSQYHSNQHKWVTNYPLILKRNEDMVREYAADIVMLLNSNGPTFNGGAVAGQAPARGRVEQLARWYYRFLQTERGKRLRRGGDWAVEPVARLMFGLARRVSSRLREGLK